MITKVKIIVKNHKNEEEEELTFGEKLSERIFRIGSSWLTILLFIFLIVAWVLYNELVPAKYVFDPFPFPLITFLLAGFAAIQAPIIMISQHRQYEKNNKLIAMNLVVENKILALHQSITISMEQQLQHVLENQMITIKLLNDLQAKAV